MSGLIKIINPKVILCEGFNAFEYTCKALNIDYSNTNFINENIKYIKLNNFDIIGYRRNIKGEIEDKYGLADFLQKYYMGLLY